MVFSPRIIIGGTRDRRYARHRNGTRDPDGGVAIQAAPDGRAYSELEVKLRRQLHVPLALRATDLTEERRRNGLRSRTGEDRRVRQIERFGADLQVPLFGNTELLVKRYVEALHAGTAHGADPCVAEGAG